MRPLLTTSKAVVAACGYVQILPRPQQIPANIVDSLKSRMNGAYAAGKYKNEHTGTIEHRFGNAG